jgi:hypothetical protein
MPPDTNPTDNRQIRFRVAAVEPFSLQDPAKQTHMMLQVEYADPEDQLRGALFELDSGQYLTYQAAITAAIASGATYWVNWSGTTTSNAMHVEGDTVAQHLLDAIANRQVLSTETNHE